LNTSGALPAGVFAAGGEDAALMPRHRAAVATDSRGHGRTVIALSWTLAPHERGPNIYGGRRAYACVTRRMTVLQAVVTAVVANCEGLDGLDVVVQDPLALHAEEASLQTTATASDEQMDAVRQRLWELVPHQLPRRTEMDRARHRDRPTMRGQGAVPAGALCL
jgi:hypothetical protein